MKPLIASNVDFAIREWSVLVVDDFRAMRALVKSLLREQGIPEIIEASDGSEALSVLEKQHIDLVITDLVMAPMNGLQLTRNIRKPGSNFAFIPILMLSAHSEEVHIRQALMAGVTDFLIKPLTPQALAAKIASIVLRPRSYVRLDTYWGPDRRRRACPVGNDRRAMIEIG